MRVQVKAGVVERLLDRRNETQQQLAARMRTTAPYLSNILRGRVEPGVEIRQRMMDALGVTDWDEIFEHVGTADREEVAV